jgi:hypothetical protein
MARCHRDIVGECRVEMENAGAKMRVELNAGGRSPGLCRAFWARDDPPRRTRILVAVQPIGGIDARRRPATPGCDR